MIGTKLAHYEITRHLGTGGMGVVYQAIDSKLGRSVAIKVLPAGFAADPDRLARFRREAQLLASLNHPNIAHIYGLEDFGDIRCIVMELIEGETLQTRIKGGPIPVDEAMTIAKQIAEALEAAHEKGVIHRDLKPGNVMLTNDGKVKVLDFGLARTYDTDPSNVNSSNSPTISMAATVHGEILGTASYMSPEQARGKAVDRRSDIFSFGAVFYELLTGKQAFPGEDAGDILATVVKTDPDWSLLPDRTPASISTLLRRCLRKDRQQRLGDAGAARIEIEEALASAATSPQTQNHQTSVSLRVAILIGLAAFIVAFAIGYRMRSPSTPQNPTGVVHLVLPLPPNTELGQPPRVIVSPNGALVAFVASRGGNAEQLYTRPMNGLDIRPIPGTNGASGPFFSPEGEWLGFFADGRLKKVSTTSGVVVPLTEVSAQGGASWGPNDTILFASGADILQVSANGGGTASALMKAEQSDAQLRRPYSPEFLPGGKAVLFMSATQSAATADERSVEVLTIATGERKVLIQEANFARYLPTGHLVFLRSGTLWAVPFDLEHLIVTGTPSLMVENVRQSYSGGAFNCAISGVCVYVAGGLDKRTVKLVDRATGTGTPLPLPPQTYKHPRFSPSGDRIVFWIEQAKCYFLIYDIPRGAPTRLTNDGDNHFPIWTPNGQQITYIFRKQQQMTGYELFSTAADGSGSAERLNKSPQHLAPITPISWSPDGVLAYADHGDIWLLPHSGNIEPRPFFQSKSAETMPAFSPDGHWLAYVSDESGKQEVYLRPYPGPGAPYPISTEGGTEPMWAGDELFYRDGSRIMGVRVSPKLPFSATRPSIAFAGTFSVVEGRSNYDVSSDGKRFVMFNADEQQGVPQINVILNWFDELKERVPVR